jgi:soluble lytic murein transglycosylase
MKSPTLTQKSPFVRQNPVRMKPKTSKAPFFWGMAAALVIATLVGGMVGQIPGWPVPLRPASLLPVSDKVYDAPLGGMDQQTARRLYRQAVQDLQSTDYTAALDKFKKLEPVYPGLKDFLALHEAEAYAGQGNEWAAQKKLNMLLSQMPDSVLKEAARYRVGQSQMRGREWEKAEKTFQEIRRDFPNSSYALGALYYLGAIASYQEQPEVAAGLLRQYLEECPNCKFSSEAATLLLKSLASPSQADYTLIGLAEASAGRDLPDTIQHLSQGDPEKTWLPLGKALIRAGKKPEGVQKLLAGLPSAKNMDEFREALDLVLNHSGSAGLSLLRKLEGQALPVGGDYVLWRLAELEPSRSTTLYAQILARYPESDYAPESGWNLLWPLLNSGRRLEYLTQAQRYIERYPYARSAPKALFWIGKLQEKSSPLLAKETYQKLVQQYPNNYYAFRAQGRLRALSGNSDPGWVTFAGRQDYPVQLMDIKQLDILPPAAAFEPGERGRRLRELAKELVAIGVPEDVNLLLSSVMSEVPASVQSWSAQLTGDRAKGLRLMREAHEAQAKAAFLSGRSTPPRVPESEWKLLYPLYFNDLIKDAGAKAGLDPFLVQALMREESYFNEFAISSSNAQGLMQLLPSTAKEVAAWEALASFKTGDLFTPAVNIRLGTRYLGFLHQQFKGNSMLSVGAYNGGPGAMKRWVQNSDCLYSDPDLFVERIPYAQSRDYIKKVFASYWNYTRLYAKSAI